MTPNDFVRALSAAAPRGDSLAKVGITAAAAAQVQQSFICVRRLECAESRVDADEAVALVENWDASQVEIGMVRFFSRSAATPVGIQIGTVEADALIVRTNEGDVVVVEPSSRGHVLWDVARNGSMLLDALLLAARVLAKRMVDEIDFDDMTAAQAEANRCAAAAGGTKYAAFYAMLLGADG